MSTAVARRSFHGPAASYRSPSHRPVAAQSADVARKLEAVPAPPSQSSLGGALLVAARAEQPTAADRERILSAVLAALRVLTGSV
jgi:hypothetical protein